MLADAGFFFTGICILNIKKQPLFELSSNIFKGSVTIEHCTRRYVICYVIPDNIWQSVYCMVTFSYFYEKQTIERNKIDIPNTQIHDRSFSYLGTGTSIKGAGSN
jgi:hypothetical protein